MDADTAIKRLKGAISLMRFNIPLGEIQEHGRSSSIEKDYRDANMVAIAALGKQVPKEPKDKMELRDFTQEVYAFRGDCPACGAERLVSTNDRYCHNCGQAIDWEGADR